MKKFSKINLNITDLLMSKLMSIFLVPIKNKNKVGVTTRQKGKSAPNQACVQFLDQCIQK